MSGVTPGYGDQGDQERKRTASPSSDDEIAKRRTSRVTRNTGTDRGTPRVIWLLPVAVAIVCGVIARAEPGLEPGAKESAALAGIALVIVCAYGLDVISRE